MSGKPKYVSKSSAPPEYVLDYWCLQRGADERFQDALHAAGMLEGADQRHGTDAPKPIAPRAESRLKSSMGF